jgi:DNA-binding beta-propeller fold protein YncE
LGFDPFRTQAFLIFSARFSLRLSASARTIPIPGIIPHQNRPPPAMHKLPMFLAAALGLASSFAFAQPASADGPYKVLQSAKVGGAGGFDYVYADSDGRRLYIARGNRMTVFDLDSLKSVGEIPDTKSVHGAAVDTKSHHGFASSSPIVMWDTDTLATIKTIAVDGNPDGIFADAASQRIFILSHRAPNVTVIDAKDGSIIGTVDIGGAPEQGVSDGHGHLYIDVEDKDNVAVVDAVTLKVTGHYDLGGKGGTPAGLAFDAKNRILFVCCRNPATAVILNADDGKIITALPLGAGTDGATFNPDTLEAFSSQGDGTLTVIKETSPTSFAVEQNVVTKPRAKTCTLDAKTGRILLITAEYGPPPPAPAPTPDQPAPQKGKGGPRAPMLPDSFTILAVGK